MESAGSGRRLRLRVTSAGRARDVRPCRGGGASDVIHALFDRVAEATAVTSPCGAVAIAGGEPGHRPRLARRRLGTRARGAVRARAAGEELRARRAARAIRAHQVIEARAVLLRRAALAVTQHMAR